MRVALIIIGILILIGVGVGLYFAFFAADTQESAQQERVAFPQADEREVTEEGNIIWYPDRGEGYVETEYVAPEVARNDTTRTWAPAGTQDTSTTNQSFGSFLESVINRFRGEPTKPRVEPRPTAPTITGDIGVAYEPGDAYTMPGGITLPTYTFPGNAGNDCERFNSETGDICINGQTFNFRNNQANLGERLGAYVGALISDAQLGSTLSTMLVSNIEDGRSLAELDIEIRDGIPYFGGNNSLAEGGIFDGGAGTGTGSNNYFRGYMFAYECTCAESLTLGILVAPASDAGVYLSHVLSLGYQDRNKRGFFLTEGKYTAGVSNSCRTRVAGSCQVVPTTKGVIYKPILFFF